MRGRYPRHPWPDNPADARATLRTKAADARRAGGDAPGAGGAGAGGAGAGGSARGR
nr:hypothetical protein [Sphingomonas changnyeongensis]